MSPPAVEISDLNIRSLSNLNLNDKIIKIFNGRFLKDHQIVENDYLWIRNGKIIDPAHLFWTEKVSPDYLIDANNSLIAPGYIELQINGAFGVDFTGDSSNIEEGLKKVSHGLLHQGVTAYCPTIVSSRAEVYNDVLKHTKPRRGSAKDGAEILGAHLEGPFISGHKYGAHEVATLVDAKRGLADLTERYGLENGNLESVAIITVAPDVEGIINIIPELSKKVPIVSLGHSAATTSVSEQAVAKGARMVTHMFNAMQQFHHRDPGMIGLLGSSQERPYYGIICDGIHVHPNSVKIAYYSHPKGAVLVTDAMAAMGLPEGNYVLGNMSVEVNPEGVYIEGTNTLAGSVIKMDECVRNFKQFTGCTTVEALEAATLHPAQAMGITDRKGTLNYGCDADLVFLDDDLNLLRIFVRGEEVELK